jgi:hypothetical protein
MTTTDYVHGYSERERQRLHDQSQRLAELRHHYQSIANLKISAGPEGTFCYTFFKAVAVMGCAAERGVGGRLDPYCNRIR